MNGANITVQVKRVSPIVALSVKLLATYQGINNRYYAAKAKKEPPLHPETSAKEISFTVRVDEVLGKRYSVVRRLGKGTFGTVVECIDTLSPTHERVAIKVINRSARYVQQSREELATLRLIDSKITGEARSRLICMKDEFMHCGHPCIVFELLGSNLYSLLVTSNAARPTGFSLQLVAKFAYQLLLGLKALADIQVDANDASIRGIIHADLKPENILLVDNRHSLIKLADFGSSCTVNRKLYKYIQSRYYRSPEIILGLPYGTPIDMWSLGCVLMEFHTRKPLFAGGNNRDQMYRFIELLGMPPESMITRSSKGLFTSTDHSERLSNIDVGPTVDPIVAESPRSITLDRSQKRVAPTVSLADRPIVKKQCQLIGTSQPKPLSQDWLSLLLTKDVYPGRDEFIQFIQLLLVYEPSKRITPSCALEHPFIKLFNTTRTATTTATTATTATATTAPVSDAKRVSTSPALNLPATPTNTTASVAKAISMVDHKDDVKQMAVMSTTTSVVDCILGSRYGF